MTTLSVSEPSAKPTRTDPLLRPFALKHLTLRNRVFSSSHEPAYSEGGMPTDRYRLYHVEKAKGGIGMTMTAGSAVVAEDSPPAFGNLHAYKDEIVPWIRRMTDEVHEHGAACMIQITHLGRRTGWGQDDWLPIVSASPIREPAHRNIPKVAEEWDVERIVGKYADAAERMQAGGMDGIEVEAYGHLFDQFLSPFTNHRDDEWGGDDERLLRFPWAVLSAIRERVGPDFVVGVRMVIDETLPVGIDTPRGLDVLRRFEDAGLIDFVNVIRGHIEYEAALTEVIPIHGMASVPHLDFAGMVREHTGLAVLHASKVDEVASARHAIREGKVDLVGMTRAHIADPHIALKVMEGREADIRPCVGATYCLDRIYEGHEALCIHNAATGREATMPHVIRPSEEAKHNIAIVGAGPAGLEAARVAADRGHKVTVFEAAPHPGGQVRLAAQDGRRKELIGIIDWRMARCEAKGVTFRFNAYAEESDVMALDPDIVLIATGGLPDAEVLEEGNDLVVSSWDILSGDAKPASNVLLFDDNGAHPGMQAASLIAKAGAQLEVVTPERFFAPEIGGLNHAAYAEILDRAGARVTINSRLVGARRSGNGLTALVGSDYSDVVREREVDQIVVEHGTLPLDDLYFALKPMSKNLGEMDYAALVAGRGQAIDTNPDATFRLFRIGDAVASRNIHAAIYDALRLVKNF